MINFKNLNFSKLRFSKSSLEVLENLKNIKAASIQLVLNAGVIDGSPKEDDLERTLFLQLRLAGVEVESPDDEPDFENVSPFFTAEFTLLCDVKKLTKSKKTIDTLISEEFWYYGSNLYQVIRSRAIMTLRDVGLPFAPPFDFTSDGIELTFTKPEYK